MDPKNNKSKIATRIILIVTTVLALASIGIAYYYYQVQDLSPKDSSAAEGCGCYYILASQEVSSCTVAKPESAFEFKVGTKNSDGKCSAYCDPRVASSIKTTSSTPTIIGCEVETMPANPGCIDVAIVNSDGDRLPGGVSSQEAITVKAVFVQPSNLANTEDDYYSSYSFTINGEKIEIDNSNAEISGTGNDKRYTISTQITDYKEAEKVTVQAFGKTVTNSEVTSLACLRTISVTQPKVASCTEIDVNLTEDQAPKVDDVWIDLNLVEDPQSLAVKFKLGTDSTTITTKDIKENLVDGTLIFDNDFLYDTNNFTSNNSFSILDSETSKYDVQASVIVNGVEINSENCTTSVELPDRTPAGEEPPSEEPSGEDPPEEDPTDPSEEEPEITSQFMTSKVGSRQCLERVAPNNTIGYTIEVENSDSEVQNIVSIKDKLPLGFTYIAGSTEINDEVVSDDSVVTVTTVGSTQEIVWETEGGWDVNSAESLKIVFNATATSDALTGSNLNEVIVTPLNTPEDATTLRAEVAVTVAQSCTAPETGLLDSNITKALLGLLIVGLATLFYRSQFGDKYAEKLISSDAYTGMKLFGLKITEPRKYFEEKSIHSIEKKRKKS